jgi:hypothetical protein
VKVAGGEREQDVDGGGRERQVRAEVSRHSPDFVISESE